MPLVTSKICSWKELTWRIQMLKQVKMTYGNFLMIFYHLEAFSVLNKLGKEQNSANLWYVGFENSHKNFNIEWKIPIYQIWMFQYLDFSQINFGGRILSVSSGIIWVRKKKAVFYSILQWFLRGRLKTSFPLNTHTHFEIPKPEETFFRVEETRHIHTLRKFQNRGNLFPQSKCLYFKNRK